MNCKDFQHWFLTKDRFADNENPDVLNHLKNCDICKNLYTIDTILEKNIETAFVQQEIPKSLVDRIELTLDHAKKPTIVTPRRIAGLVAGFAVIFVLVFMVFFNKPFRYQTLHQLSETAVARHLKGDMSLSFTADEIEPAVAMMSKELEFKVILPDLKNQGYILLGGRLCVLDKCKIAYLFYTKQDKTCSLFILDYDYLDFQMAEGSRFSNDVKGCHTDIWKEKGQVYAMVY